uniref:DUF4062 domain-containing protein n=1 Tax=Candidatus Kentrum sp. TUN TaxID=2126343 RepID=A0A451APP9_9GAMM|nr:MAG: protein of unknown function (DUF4062) [Candidatus Kentron sp. TUN]VFK64168.1 MAG: protein of unknown function (DUF4062) [Candidatus Kentron sp. TUN]VFK68007.1 MAG: protein of unknown function (DUF4062) [Candidatus Kentron sp. TUN]
MTKVFISSTGHDLAEYRKAAIDECNRLHMVPMAMEFFEAMGVGAVAGSQEQLDKADVYVGIFAHRYGYIEDGYDKSVTEIEFDYAGERGLERLCFAIDPDFDWPPSKMDLKNYDPIQAFKFRIHKKLIRAQFTDIQDFKLKFHHALSEWQKKNPQSDSSSPRIAPNPSPDPWADQQIQSLVQGYYGSVREECAKLPFGVVDPGFANTEKTLALPDVYTALDVVSSPRREEESEKCWGLLRAPSSSIWSGE